MLLDRRIVGRVLTRAGRPAAKVMIEVLPAHPGPNDSPIAHDSATTDVDGQYEFEYLRTGDYYLGVNLDRPPFRENPYAGQFSIRVPISPQLAINLREPVMRHRVGCVGQQCFLQMFQRLVEAPGLGIDLLQREMRLHYARLQLQRLQEALLRALGLLSDSEQITEFVESLGVVGIDPQFRFQLRSRLFETLLLPVQRAYSEVN